VSKPRGDRSGSEDHDADRVRADLTLVATPIGNLGDLTPRAIETLRDVDVIAAEDTRRIRALLTHASIPASGRVRSLRAENEREVSDQLVGEMRRGARVAFVTDAGMPTISDPGDHLVRACIDAGLSVTCVPGPSALLTALALSGLPIDRFVFEGFLPRKGPARRERLGAIATEPRTVVFFESPRRIVATLDDLVAGCGPSRRVVVARELTKIFEEVWRGPLGEATGSIAEQPRGEFVVVVEGAQPGEIGDREVAAAVDRALSEGASPRDAATHVAEELGVGRNRAYEMAISRRPRAGDRRR
jgi:16S rRNA (cytidine1402-2'-O)-methyltransferase